MRDRSLIFQTSTSSDKTNVLDPVNWIFWFGLSFENFKLTTYNKFWTVNMSHWYFWWKDLSMCTDNVFTLWLWLFFYHWNLTFSLSFYWCQDISQSDHFGHFEPLSTAFCFTNTCLFLLIKKGILRIWVICIHVHYKWYNHILA